MSSDVSLLSFFFFLRTRRPPRPTLFPYPTLFRSVVASPPPLVPRAPTDGPAGRADESPLLDSGRLIDRKSTRLNSSHSQISYAVFCLKKKNCRIGTPLDLGNSSQRNRRSSMHR